jgi:hypothetical protein
MGESEIGRRLSRALLKVVGFDLVFLMEDSLYVMKREEHWQEYNQNVVDLRERFRNSMIAGGAFGLALIFSLRRYFPGQFTGFSVNRLLIELTILSGSFFGSSISVLLGASKFVHAIKKDYVLKADPDAYNYLQYFKHKY